MAQKKSADGKGDLNFTITGDDQSKGVFAAVSKSINELIGKTETLKKKTDNVVASMNKAGTGDAARGGARKAGGKAVGGAAAGLGGIVSGLFGGPSEARQMGGLAGMAGVPVGKFHDASRAVSLSGVEPKDFADILKDVDDRKGDFFATGGGPMRDFFEKVLPLTDTTSDDFKGLDSLDSLRLFVETLEGAGLPRDQIVFHMEALSSGLISLLPVLKDGAAEMDRLTAKFGEQGSITAENVRAAKKGQEAYVGMAGAASILSRNVSALAVESGAVDFLADSLTGLSQVANNVLSGSQGYRITIDAPEPGELRELPELLRSVTGEARKMSTAIETNMSRIPAAMRPGIDGAQDTTEAFRVMEDEVTGNSYVPDMVDAIQLHFGRLDGAMVDPARQATSAVEDAMEDVAFGVTGTLKDALKAGEADFSDFGDTLATSALRMRDRLLDDAFAPIEEGISSMIGSMAGGGSTTSGGGGFLSGLGSLLGFGLSAAGGGSAIAGAAGGTIGPGGTATFEGGGFTGRGSRTGGMDGRGGFPAILHPNETVIDHTRGGAPQSAAPVYITINTPDVESFRRSRTQVAADLGRAVAAGRRGM